MNFATEYPLEAHEFSEYINIGIFSKISVKMQLMIFFLMFLSFSELTDLQGLMIIFQVLQI